MGVNCDACSNDNQAIDLRDQERPQRYPARQQRPPFRQLPDMFVTMVMLSYLGFEDEVKYLLCKISRASKRYYGLQQQILLRVLTSYEPWVKEVVEFGSKSHVADCVYPREEQLLEMPRDDIARLGEIRLWHGKGENGHQGLTGIQLVFASRGNPC